MPDGERQACAGLKNLTEVNTESSDSSEDVASSLFDILNNRKRRRQMPFNRTWILVSFWVHLPKLSYFSHLPRVF